MLALDLIVEPPRVSGIAERAYCDSAPTYSQYNYFRGLSSRIKRRHFQVALELTRDRFHRVNALDFGCADGFFLPSLARYFPRVAGVDQDPDFVTVAAKVVADAGLDNVQLVCNRGLAMAELRSQMPQQPFGVAFLLEVLEHVGETPETMYEDKLQLLRDMEPLLARDALLVVSVPKMIGLGFLLQRMGLAALRLQRETLSTAELLRAAVLRDTSHLEHRWHRLLHIGFNHERMERTLDREFRVVARRDGVFQLVYALQARR